MPDRGYGEDGGDKRGERVEARSPQKVSVKKSTLDTSHWATGELNGYS